MFHRLPKSVSYYTRHDIMIRLLRSAGIDGRDIRIIPHLYWGQTAQIRAGNGMTTGKFQVIKCGGVFRRGCILSPILFNLYLENVFRTS